MESRQKVALIAGLGQSDTSIGASIAMEFKDKGYTTIGVDVCNGDTENMVDHFIKVDLTDEIQVNALFSWMQKNSLSPNVVVNCAGINVMGSIQEVSVEDFRRTLDVNLVSNFILLKAWSSPGMHPEHIQKAYIAITSDTGTFIPKGNSTAYASSKAGANGFIMSVARELNKYDKEENWHISALALGRVAGTPMDVGTMNQMCDNMRITPQQADVLLNKNIPLGRGMTTCEVAEWTRFVAEQGTFASGNILRIDGGQLQG